MHRKHHSIRTSCLVVFAAMMCIPADAANAQVISACVHKQTGATRILIPGLLPNAASCHANEAPLTWNAQGPAGPPGKVGLPGVAGPPGPAVTVTCPGCDLQGAEMPGAHLAGAYLLRANLAGAHFVGADFTGATLRGVTLTGADLTQANLTDADLQGSYVYFISTFGMPELTGVIWSNTICPDGSNSDANGGSCDNHFAELVAPGTCNDFDCGGVCNGPAVDDANQVCCPSGVVDACGVCDGDGTACIGARTVRGQMNANGDCCVCVLNTNTGQGYNSCADCGDSVSCSLNNSQCQISGITSTACDPSNQVN